MRILVSGTRGFLAPIVADHLEAHGHEVKRFDVMDPDSNGAGDVYTHALGCDAICHLGGWGDVYRCAEDPAGAFDANVGGTAHVVRAAKDHGCRLIHCGTWEQYGATGLTCGVLTETEPCRPIAPGPGSKLAYAASKHAAELCALANDVDSVSLRLGSAYGPGMRPNAVIPKWIALASKGKPIQVQGKGDQFRQWTHASDVAAAFRLACEGDAKGFRVFNVVADEVTTIAEMADTIASHYGVEVVHTEARAGDVPSARVSSELIQGVLGWKPTVSFKDGLAGMFTEGAA